MEENNMNVVLESYTRKAQDLLSDDGKVEEILRTAETKLKEVPEIGEKVAQLPLMLSMIRSYITKEYTQVSNKVVISMIGAFLYLITPRDLINDKIPVLGIVDDVAILGLALKLNEKELEEYSLWRENKDKKENKENNTITIQ